MSIITHQIIKKVAIVIQKYKLSNYNTNFNTRIGITQSYPYLIKY